MLRPANVLGKYLAAARISLRNRLAYPASFAGTALTFFLFVFVFSRVWAAAYADKASIAGYDYASSLWYFIAAELSLFGFGRMFFALSEDVKSGQVAYQLARPYNFVAYHFADRMGPAAAETGLLAIEGAVMGILATGSWPIASPLQAAAFVLSFAMAACLGCLLQLAVAMTAFWVEENEAFFWIYQKFALVLGTLLPIEFLPGWLQGFVYWTPFPWLSYAPARILAAWEPGRALALLGAQAAWLAVALGACSAIFALGKGRVTSQGG